MTTKKKIIIFTIYYQIRSLREFSNDDNNKSRYDEMEDEGFVSIREDDDVEEYRNNDDEIEEKDNVGIIPTTSIDPLYKRKKKLPVQLGMDPTNLTRQSVWLFGNSAKKSNQIRSHGGSNQVKSSQCFAGLKSNQAFFFGAQIKSNQWPPKNRCNQINSNQIES